jgi:hypothetical protein
MTKNTGKKPDLLGSANYVDPVRNLTVYSRRTLGNHKRCWYCGAMVRNRGRPLLPQKHGRHTKGALLRAVQQGKGRPHTAGMGGVP